MRPLLLALVLVPTTALARCRRQSQCGPVGLHPGVFNIGKVQLDFTVLARYVQHCAIAKDKRNNNGYHSINQSEGLEVASCAQQCVQG